MSHVLLVEDDDTMGLTLEMSLSDQGHQVRWCKTLAKARAAATVQPPELVILDLGLPDGDGLELCRELREAGNIAPILVLTARSTLDSRLTGLSAGADDYVTKPFDLPEVLARVTALLRRTSWHRPGNEVAIGRLRVDFRRREAWVDDTLTPLTDLELKLLRFLLDRQGEVVSREEILSRVWGLEPTTRTRTVDVFISRLRRNIEVDSARPKFLLNVRGVGYRLKLADP